MHQTDKAVEFYMQGLSICDDVGNRAVFYQSLFELYYKLDKFESSIEFAQRAVTIAIELGNKKAEGAFNCNLGAAHTCLRQFDKAIEFYVNAVTIAQEIGNRELEKKASDALCTSRASLKVLDLCLLPLLAIRSPR